MPRIFLFLRLLLGIGFFSTGLAHAYFQSLHQLPFQYPIRAEQGANGNITYINTPLLSGFKDQYAPSGVSGCVIGYPDFRGQCLTPKGGFGFDLLGESSYPEYKVYIPAGTTFFGLSGYLPQSEIYAAAVRLGNPPVRNAPLSSQEYQAAKMAQNLNEDFAKLRAGEERIMVHDGGGGINLSGTARIASNPMQVGQWLYVRVLNGGYITGLGAMYEVNREQYRGWYDQAVATGLFNSDGDPKEGNVPVEPPAFQGFTLSSSSWTVGSGAFSLTLTASPAGAMLPGNCTVSPAGVLAIGPVQGSTATVSIDTAAVNALVPDRNDFSISCGGKTATFTIFKSNPNVVATATVTELQQSPDSPVVLMLSVQHPASEVSPSENVTYYTGGLVPAHQFGMTGYDDVVFFLKTFSAPGVSPAVRGWALLFRNQSLNSVAFESNRPLTSANQVVQIPLIYKKQDFKDLGARMRFAYTLQDGQFKIMDVVWDPSR